MRLSSSAPPTDAGARWQHGSSSSSSSSSSSRQLAPAQACQDPPDPGWTHHEVLLCDPHGPAAQGGVPDLLHLAVEAVYVQVQHAAPLVRHYLLGRRRRRCARRPWLLRLLRLRLLGLRRRCRQRRVRRGELPRPEGFQLALGIRHRAGRLAAAPPPLTAARPPVPRSRCLLSLWRTRASVSAADQCAGLSGACVVSGSFLRAGRRASCELDTRGDCSAAETGCRGFGGRNGLEQSTCFFRLASACLAAAARTAAASPRSPSAAFVQRCA